jgi:hypothetical protein
MKGKNDLEPLPKDFDGRFYFTNFSDEDFETKWNNKIYTFPSLKTTPLIIADESLEHIQQIRKYFAERLAKREYEKTSKFMDRRNGIPNPNGGGHMVASFYNEEIELKPYVARCLESMPRAKPNVKDAPEIADKPLKAMKIIGQGSSDGKTFPNVDLEKEFAEEDKNVLTR